MHDQNARFSNTAMFIRYYYFFLNLAAFQHVQIYLGNIRHIKTVTILIFNGNLLFVVLKIKNKKISSFPNTA